MILLIFLVVGVFINAVVASVDSSLKKSYDYVIVGAGSAGSVIANRLSEDIKNSVLLLEAGSHPELITEVPGLTPTTQQTYYDWQFKTVPQKNSCHAFKDQRSNWPRGKVLGGTSQLNYMIYVRGNRKDFDKWAEDGATGWNYDDVLPYFKKSEDNRIPSIRDNGYHGTEGELTVEYQGYKHPLEKVFLEAGEELGYEIGDYNGASQKVFSAPQVTTRNGRRCSTEKAFLRQILGRRNLDVFTSAFVKKINFDDKKRAKEVIFDHNNEEKTVLIRREVIVSAGAINSPQLLMLSGIGPKDELKKLEISVIADLPVGKNLQDHVITLGMVFSFEKLPEFVGANVQDLTNFLKGEKGPYSSIVGVEAIGFVNTEFNDDEEWPDIEIVLTSNSGATDGGKVSKHNIGLTDEVFDKYFLPYVDKDTMTCIPVVQRTKSRGEISLNSSDPYDHPIIDPKYFSHLDDLKLLVAGMRLCLDLASTNAMKKIKAKPLSTTMPGCERYEKFTDNYLECVARAITQTGSHPVGTCKMGATTDESTVVDPSLRVKGVHGIRVADASIMPTIVSANTNAASIMIGEKAADIILQNAQETPLKQEL